MKFMKKRLLMISFLVVGFLSATNAQVKNLIVQQGSDVTLEIPLSESPQLTYEGTDVVIKYGDNTFSLPVSSKFNIYFEKTGTNIERLITEKPLLTDGSTVILSNQPANSRVIVYNAQGHLCLQTTVDGSGQAVVDLSTLAKGIYVIKSTTLTFKTIRR